MLLTTICYIDNGDSYLMLLRNKKKNDINEGKWLGIGGKFEEGETPEECIKREVLEETGLTLDSYRFRGLITFSLEGNGVEYVFVYTSDSFHGELTDCDEGELRWIPKKDILNIGVWEGDKIFLKLLLEDAPFFSLKLTYDKNDKLIDHSLESDTTLK